MYPLNAVLIGLDPSVGPDLRRELLNRSVSLEGEFTKAAEASNALKRSLPEKRLLILHIPSIGELSELSNLSASFPGWPIVALVDGFDPKTSLGSVVVETMRAGASQILSTPLNSEELKETLDRIAVQFVYSISETKVIAVAGATGGSGATTLALNLAFEIADRFGLRCVLAELSLRMGVLASHLNLKPVHNINDLLRDPSRIDTYLTQQVLVRVADNFEILAGPQNLSAPSPTSCGDVARVVDNLKQIADVVVLDLPCTYDDLYFEMIAQASHTILIGEQTLPSIRSLKMIRDAVNRKAGTEHIVINKFDARNKGFAVDRLLKPLGVSRLHTVARDDLGISAAMEAATTLRLAHTRSAALSDIVALADRVLAIETTPRNKPMGLFSRLGRALVNA